MVCRKCGQELLDSWIVCPVCGTRTQQAKTQKKRGNGQGWIYKLPNGKYLASVTIGYVLDENGKRHRKTRSKVFTKRSDAVAALPGLKVSMKELEKEEKKSITFKALYDTWLPTHRAGKDTINCYKAAIKYFEPLYGLQIADVDVDDLQECVDACPHGKRTRENMRAVIGLMYKYGIPRHIIPDNLNLGPFLKVDGDPAAHRASFTDVEIEKIKKACGVIPQAEVIYIMIYLGFRPSEFLDLKVEDVDLKRGCIIGGAKTEAGRGRVVTVSPKIRPFLAQILPEEGYVIGGKQKPVRLQYFTEEVFYPTLAAIGIDNPLVEISGGKLRHKYTPHSCRHTFATLMKRVEGSDKDKQELIGHASAEMLRYYQDVDLTDLKAITDAI